MTATREQRTTVVPFPKDPEPVNSGNIIPSLRQCIVELNATIRKLSPGSLSDGEKAGHFDGVACVFTTPLVSNAEFTVYHALGRRPIGRYIVGQNYEGHLWDSKHKWTGQKAVFTSDRSGVEFTILLF